MITKTKGRAGMNRATQNTTCTANFIRSNARRHDGSQLLTSYFREVHHG